MPHAYNFMYPQPHRLCLPLQKPEEDHLSSSLFLGGVRLSQLDNRVASRYLQLPETRTRPHSTPNHRYLSPHNPATVLLPDVPIHHNNDERTEIGGDYLSQIRHQTQTNLHHPLCLVSKHDRVFSHVHDRRW